MEKWDEEICYLEGHILLCRASCCIKHPLMSMRGSGPLYKARKGCIGRKQEPMFELVDLHFI